MLEISIIKCLSDNYSYLIRDVETNLVGVVDPSEFEPVDSAIIRSYKKLDYILNTHHHNDHVGGNKKLKQKYNSKVVSSKVDELRIPEIDLKLSGGDFFKFGKTSFEIIFIPGHTKGHIAFFSQSEKVIFTGNTLFSLGCGRIFEGTYEQMFSSLQLIKSFPENTKIYCGHEYTLKNAEFCIKHDKDNSALIEKIKSIKKKLDNGFPTIPTTIKEELDCNIFLRSKDVGSFSKLRDLKDNF